MKISLIVSLVYLFSANAFANSCTAEFFLDGEKISKTVEASSAQACGLIVQNAVRAVKAKFFSAQIQKKYCDRFSNFTQVSFTYRTQYGTFGSADKSYQVAKDQFCQ